jgi:hypothetical protein
VTELEDLQVAFRAACDAVICSKEYISTLEAITRKQRRMLWFAVSLGLVGWLNFFLLLRRVL